MENITALNSTVTGNGSVVNIKCGMQEVKLKIMTAVVFDVHKGHFLYLSIVHLLSFLADFFVTVLSLTYKNVRKRFISKIMIGVYTGSAISMVALVYRYLKIYWNPASYVSSACEVLHVFSVYLFGNEVCTGCVLVAVLLLHNRLKYHEHVVTNNEKTTCEWKYTLFCCCFIMFSFALRLVGNFLQVLPLFYFGFFYEFCQHVSIIYLCYCIWKFDYWNQDEGSARTSLPYMQLVKKMVSSVAIANASLKLARILVSLVTSSIGVGLHARIALSYIWDLVVVTEIGLNVFYVWYHPAFGPALRQTVDSIHGMELKDTSGDSK